MTIACFFYPAIVNSKNKHDECLFKVFMQKG